MNTRKYVCAKCHQPKKKPQMSHHMGQPMNICTKCNSKINASDILELVKAGPLVKSNDCREAGPGLSVSSYESMRKICATRSKPSVTASSKADSPAGYWCRGCEIGQKLLAGEDVLPNNVTLLEMVG